MLEIKIENFEGPLDLLLHLIEKNKMQIADVKISIIADEYIALINQLEDDKLEELSEFVEMAAILLSIKSSMLLPKYEEEEEVDERERLIERLIEYKKFKIISEELKDFQTYERYIGKEASIPEEVLKYQPEIDVMDVVGDYKFEDLLRAFNTILKRQEDRIDTVRSKFSEIRREEYSVEDVKEKLLSRRYDGERLSFFSMVRAMNSKVELIVTFLAILELIKEGYADVTQSATYDDIFVDFLEEEAVV